MVSRDELVEAGARAWHVDSWKIDGDAVVAIIDAVEPLIRADERAALLADLITQVEALRAIYASHGAHLALRDALSILAEASE
jgi:hypothetical protein